MQLLIPLAILLGAVVYFMTPGERARALAAIRAGLRQAYAAAERAQADDSPFSDTLRARTARALVTPALIAVHVVMFLVVLFGPGSFSDPDTLVRWGASFGPRTTNGEWWRLLTAIFVHAGPIGLIINLVALAQIGSVMERLFGRPAFAAVYLAAGLLSNLATLAAHPMVVSAGSSGATFGICGLLIAWLIVGWVFHSAVTIPVAVVTRLSPAIGLFVLYSLVAGSGLAESAGLAAGLAWGLTLARGTSERTPPARRVAVAMGSVLAIAVVSAVPLRGLADVRPEIAKIIDIEARTSSGYDRAVSQFRLGQGTPASLAGLIDRTIVPELTAARARLSGFKGVPREHAALVASAEEYLRLREESWRMRADALRRIGKATLREADHTERAALDALRTITDPKGN
jgi:rhomboid protease GluP